MEDVITAAGKDVKGKGVDVKMVRMARPKKVYESRGSNSVDYFITDAKDGHVTNAGTLAISQYDEFVQGLNVFASGWERVRFDLNPFIVKTDFVFDSDIRATQRFKLGFFVAIPLVLAAIVFAGLNISSSFHRNISGVEDSLSKTRKYFDAAFQGVNTRTTSNEASIQNLLSRQERLEHVIYNTTRFPKGDRNVVTLSKTAKLPWHVASKPKDAIDELLQGK
jgi:hypothetical protein